MIKFYTRVRKPSRRQFLRAQTNRVFMLENRRVKKALNYLFQEVIKSASVTTYSKSQLRDRGYPYAKKHGRIQKSKIKPLKVYQVHDRKGSFVKGFKQEFTPARIGNKGAVGKITYEDGSTWSEAVFMGTKKLLPRNPIRGTARSRPVQRQIKKILLGTK